MTTMFRRLIFAAIAIVAGSRAYADSEWLTNYSKAVEQAKESDKAILLDFTGSDWCPWCIKMKKETLDTGAFRDYAEKNLVLMEVDFPQNKPQPDSVKKQNAELGKKFKADGFPTFVVVSKTGRVLWRQVGYLEGGPEAFIGDIKKVYKGSSGTGSGGGTDDFDAFFNHAGASPTP